MAKLCLLLIIIMTLSACSAVPDKGSENANTFSSLESGENVAIPKAQLSCYPAFNALDELAFKNAGTLVGNRIPSMPWLRYNRLITQDIRTQSKLAEIGKLLQQMSALAIQGLSYELKTIPEHQQEHWRKHYQTKLAPIDYVKQCSTQLLKWQLVSPQNTLENLKEVPEDNDYSRPARVVGLYPLATVPFRIGVVQEQKKLAREWGQISDKQWFEYRPELVSNAKDSEEDWRLLKRYAPTWLIDSKAPANLPGSPYWQGKQLNVNTQQASTYAFVSEARWKQQPITQLNYIVWFSERPRLKRLDWVAGQHDAVVFRVNLSQQGEVIAYDSIHLCGCWYRLFLPEGRPFKKQDRYWREPVLMQRIRLSAKSNVSVAIYLQADTHHIQYLRQVTELNEKSQGTTDTRGYQLQPFSKLLALPGPYGIRPVFDENGYVPDSERPERWLFWPMGVRNPGALRRFGDHAISFVGRRYFDDPHLLEKVSGLWLE